jgi:hypothetical protein
MFAVAALGIAGATLSGCASRTPNSPADEDAAPDIAAPGTIRPNGTLSNGLLPEQWGDTN